MNLYSLVIDLMFKVVLFQSNAIVLLKHEHLMERHNFPNTIFLDSLAN